MNISSQESLITPAPVTLKLLRDENGLLRNIEYQYLPNGKINYRALLQREHLYFNKEKEEQIIKTYGKDYEKIPILEIDDKYLLITLGGINYLASTRGYLAVLPKVDFVSDFRCVVTTTITWVPNFETDFATVSYGQCAGASLANTSGFSSNFLESIAANRAFVRAVRFFLGLSIVGQDEISPKNNARDDAKSQNDSNDLFLSPLTFLEKKVTNLNLSFVQYKNAVIKKYKDKLSSDPETWESFADIPKVDALFLLESLNKQQPENNNK
jgi:hypothetical protein